MHQVQTNTEFSLAYHKQWCLSIPFLETNIMCPSSTRKISDNMGPKNNEWNIQGVSKRALQLWKRIEIYTEDIHNVLNCKNVAKHTEFYLG
jgi:hypothetical protein